MNGYFRVRNWERFQHYKDRNPPWIKLHTELLDHYEFSRLQDASKLLAMCIWLLAARSDNKIPSDPDWIQRRCNLKSKPDLKPLLDGGFIEWIQEVRDTEQDASGALAESKQRASPLTEERRGRGEADPSARASNCDGREGKASGKGSSRRCPADFQPDLAYAVTQIADIDAAAEAQAMKDWEFKHARSDWSAVWRTWVKRCKDTGQYAKAGRFSESSAAEIARKRGLPLAN